ncbi:MAG: hypothetical protein ACFE9S_16515 [Candidatus Hermodarchaeota archaeon]
MKDSKKYYFCLILALVLSFIFMPSLVIAGRVIPPDAPPPPQLYPITPNPDYDGSIRLEWSEVSGAKYLVYRLREGGGEDLLGTTWNEHYTDMRSSGTWTYKVKAKDPYWGVVSPFSNAESVTVEGIVFAEGFLYAQSSISRSWDEGIWVDEDAAITSVEDPGNYFVIYTATYVVTDGDGSGWVKLSTNSGDIEKTMRLYECVSTETASPDIYGTFIVADVITLDSGSVKAKVYFDTSGVYTSITILERSICAIPLGGGYEYSSTTTPYSWADQTVRVDPHIGLQGLTGEYYAIYSASFKVTESFSYQGVHSNGWTRFATDTEDLVYTQRSWEFPAIYGCTEMVDTILIADKVELNNENLNVQLRLFQRNDPQPTETLTLMERSLTLIPLTYKFNYEMRDNNVEYPNVNQDIIFSNIYPNCFIMYTANIRIVDNQPLPDNAMGNGWAAYNNEEDTLDYTKRYHEFDYGYGTSFQQTKYLVEVFNFLASEIKVEFYWQPNDVPSGAEEFSFNQRSMILIPFIP